MNYLLNVRFRSIGPQTPTRIAKFYKLYAIPISILCRRYILFCSPILWKVNLLTIAQEENNA